MIIMKNECVSLFVVEVSVILESWKLKFGAGASVVRLVSAIQRLNMQEVVDEFYREFQIPRAVKTKKTSL